MNPEVPQRVHHKCSNFTNRYASLEDYWLGQKVGSAIFYFNFTDFYTNLKYFQIVVKLTGQFDFFNGR
jgi:hypothetical protein